MKRVIITYLFHHINCFNFNVVGMILTKYFLLIIGHFVCLVLDSALPKLVCLIFIQVKW